MTKECKGPYTSNCMKLGLLRLVSKAGSGAVAILPGVSLNWARPELHIEQNQLEDSDSLDSVLLTQLGEILSNVTLSVRVLERDTPLSFARALLGESAVGTGDQA